MIFVKGGGYCIVLSFACKLFEVSSVIPQKIIKFDIENKEPCSMYKNINKAILCTRLLISRRKTFFLKCIIFFLYLKCVSFQPHGCAGCWDGWVQTAKQRSYLCHNRHVHHYSMYSYFFLKLHQITLFIKYNRNNDLINKSQGVSGWIKLLLIVFNNFNKTQYTNSNFCSAVSVYRDIILPLCNSSTSPFCSLQNRANVNTYPLSSKAQYRFLWGMKCFFPWLVLFVYYAHI